MIGTGTALLTSAIIGAGTGLAGAGIASSASKNAAKTQQQAAQQGYQQSLQLQSPYLAVGNQALSTLGRLMGPPAGARYAAPAPLVPSYASPIRTAVPRNARTQGYPLSRMA